MRFAIQGDIHNFNRVAESYLKRMLADASRIGCKFIALLGDNLDGASPNTMRLSAESAVPVIWQRGDHEFFSEWGRTCIMCLNKRHHLLGGEPDPTVFMRGAMPRFEAMTGQPTAWAFTLQGILFVIAHNGKNHVWHDWQIRWLRQLLAEHRHRTTVLLSHRTLDERGETANALRSLLKEFPQVILFCDAHIHSPHPLRLIGNTLQVGTEGNGRDNGKLTYEGDWYVVVELAKDAVRIWRRRMKTDEMVLLNERKVTTTLNELETGNVHLAFLMSDRGVRFNPTIWLRDAKLRVWGVECGQLLPMTAKVDADEDWRKLGIDRVEQVTISQPDDLITLKETIIPVRFEPDPNNVGIAGTVGDGTQVILMALVKAPKGMRVRLEVDALKEDGTMESRHWIDGESDGGIMALQGVVGHIYLGAQSAFGEREPIQKFWRWEGVDGKTEIDMPHPDGKPREATKLIVRLKLVKPLVGATVYFALFAFPEQGGFFVASEGKQTITKVVKVRIGKSEFNIGDLAAGESNEIEVGGIAGGEQIELRCAGSKLALIELIGEADGIMCHALCKVRREDEKFVLGELTEQAKGFDYYGWGEIAVTCLWDWKENRWLIVSQRASKGDDQKSSKSS
ncbi:MAG: metallophosphoesterase [Armatimonadota bacterium]|nr:metallophosphoesterase [Armatimonadota bacterium]